MSSETITRNDLTNILNEIVAIDGTDMTAQEIDDFVDSLNVSGINAVDYIVEQGTSGMWTYRKWNSGVAECWGQMDSNNVAMTTQEGNGYYAQLTTYAYPTGLFVGSSAPLTSIGAHLSGALGGFSISYNWTDAVKGYWWATRSVTKNCYLFVHAKGTWK